MGTEGMHRRLDELNLAIDVATRELSKLVVERDALQAELAGEQVSMSATGDVRPEEEGDRFIVPWSPEEDRL